MKCIYSSEGPAGEYSRDWSLNFFGSCSHGCKYCYGPGKLRISREKYSREVIPLKKFCLADLEEDLTKISGNGEKVHLNFFGDPYAPEAEEITRPVLELFQKYNVPFQLLTKGGMRAKRDFDLYGPQDEFACTLTFIDPLLSQEWEPKAALPGERIAVLKEAKRAGIRTWVSCEPVIVPSETLSVVKASAQYVDFYWVGKWNKDKDERPKLIDWKRFRNDAETLLKRLGKPYGIKDDLLKASAFTWKEPKRLKAKNLKRKIASVQ